MTGVGGVASACNGEADGAGALEATRVGAGATTCVCAGADVVRVDGRPRCHIGLNELSSISRATTPRPMTTNLLRSRFMLVYFRRLPEPQPKKLPRLHRMEERRDFL